MTLVQPTLAPAPLQAERTDTRPIIHNSEREADQATGRHFQIKPAVRQPVSLLLGLAGPSGSGKTYSALRLATGMARITGGDIVVVDTENQRAQHYADDFKFQHLDFVPPYGPLDYLAAIQTANRIKPAVIIVDSLSHEHDGEGGTLDCVTAEVERLAGADSGLQQKLATAAWRRPKAARRAFLSGLLRLRSHVIVCIRANERSRMGREMAGGDVIDFGLTPVAAPEFLFELTCSALLRAGAQGVPTWTSTLQGEHAAIKLPRQFEPIFASGGPLHEVHGEMLARWAKGESIAPVRPESKKGRSGRTGKRAGRIAARRAMEVS